jgi:hypothetical protein
MHRSLLNQPPSSVDEAPLLLLLLLRCYREILLCLRAPCRSRDFVLKHLNSRRFDYLSRKLDIYIPRTLYDIPITSFPSRSFRCNSLLFPETAQWSIQNERSSQRRKTKSQETWVKLFQSSAFTTTRDMRKLLTRHQGALSRFQRSNEPNVDVASWYNGNLKGEKFARVRLNLQCKSNGR